MTEKLNQKAMRIFESFSQEDLKGFLAISLRIEEKREKDIAIVLKNILSHYECKRCLDCCRYCTPVLLEDELLTYMKIVGPKFLDMLDENCTMDVLKAPCGFLRDMKCGIHDKKPFVCSLYPFSLKTQMVNLCLCPMGKEIENDVILFYNEYRTQHNIKIPLEVQQKVEAWGKSTREFSEELHGIVNFPQGRLLEEMTISDRLIILFDKHLSRTKNASLYREVKKPKEKA
ncbi:MAG: YkgJ family cysteine cluster protein [Candidatus Methanoperedens sp.]|nr:YkgJ family cysteine cluster protein [Candidatus Methanoperedens sp.]